MCGVSSYKSTVNPAGVFILSIFIFLVQVGTLGFVGQESWVWVGAAVPQGKAQQTPLQRLVGALCAEREPCRGLAASLQLQNLSFWEKAYSTK